VGHDEKKLIVWVDTSPLMTSKKLLALASISVAVIIGLILVILLPIITQPSMEEMVPPTLAAFFDTFDQNQDDAIDISEAQTFFNWCEANVQYRYDDEQQVNPAQGIPVGDNRPGAEYWQKPIETYQERMGDCEDMAILNVAFYRYHGISAYVATVNAEGEQVDHAVCVVKLGATPQEAADYLGGIVYYELADGYYMLVDSAYSNQFGSAGSNPGETSQLLEGGKFTIEDLITLEDAYRRSGA